MLLVSESFGAALTHKPRRQRLELLVVPPLRLGRLGALRPAAFRRLLAAAFAQRHGDANALILVTTQDLFWSERRFG